MVLGLSACSLFSSDDTIVLKPKALQPLKKESVQLTEAWSKNIGEGVGSNYETLQPAVKGERLYVASAKGHVFALDAQTGQELWENNLNVPVGGAVTVGSNKVLIGTLKGGIIALDKSDGHSLWKTRVSSEVLSLPVIKNNIIAVKSIDDTLTILDAKTGKLIWNQSAVQPSLTLRSSSSPTLVDQEAVIAGYTNGNVKAFRLDKGVPLWDTRISTPKGSTELERMIDVDSTPLLVGTTIFTGSYQGNVVALDLYSGSVIWKQAISTYKPLAQGFGSVYVTDQNGFVGALDQKTGAAEWWQKDLEYRHVSAPTTFNNYVVVGDYKGYIHLLSQVDGSFAGRYKAGSSPIKAQPLAEGNMLYVLTSDGKLVALKKQ